MSLSMAATTLDSAALPPRDGPAAAAAPRGRASWSGLLRLSLVTVPVKAYPAISITPEYRCHQLHAGCGQRIRYDGRVVVLVSGRTGRLYCLFIKHGPGKFTCVIDPWFPLAHEKEPPPNLNGCPVVGR
jgi:hypothetical protein